MSKDAMGQYEYMASALLVAYRTGTPDAMARHWALTWHRRTWQAMRTYVQVDLGRRADDNIDITIDDARYLVAREHGFESWEALKADALARPADGLITVKPVSVLTGASDRTSTSTRLSA